MTPALLRGEWLWWLLPPLVLGGLVGGLAVLTPLAYLAATKLSKRGGRSQAGSNKTKR